MHAHRSGSGVDLDAMRRVPERRLFLDVYQGNERAIGAIVIRKDPGAFYNHLAVGDTQVIPQLPSNILKRVINHDCLIVKSIGIIVL